VICEKSFGNKLSSSTSACCICSKYVSNTSLALYFLFYILGHNYDMTFMYVWEWHGTCVAFTKHVPTFKNVNSHTRTCAHCWELWENEFTHGTFPNWKLLMFPLKTWGSWGNIWTIVGSFSNQVANYHAPIKGMYTFQSRMHIHVSTWEHAFP